MTDRQHRQKLERELIERNEIRIQAQLLELLRIEGEIVTQATLSRDLQDIGAVKGSNGYEISEIILEARAKRIALRKNLQNLIHSVERGGNLIVVHTASGSAKTIQNQLQHVRMRGVIGMLADDDTVFIVAQSTPLGAAILRILRRIARLN